MPVKIDIIILSYAKTEELKNTTIQAIDSLLASEEAGKIEFNIVVIESNKALQPFQFENTITIYPPDKFGFNKYLNIGIQNTFNNYVCLCNNDLIFHRNWASELLNFTHTLETETVVLSPFCNTSHRYFLDLEKPVEGYFGYFAGHCFFTNRKTLGSIGNLDEKINFWFADMDFINLLKKYSIPHYLVPQAKVSHLISQSTISFSKAEMLKYTYYPRIYFSYKWEHHNTFLYAKNILIYLLKRALVWGKTLTGVHKN